MRRKALLTAILCTVLALASCDISRDFNNITVVEADETEASEGKEKKKKESETKAPETKAPETKAPETDPPETKPAETQAPPETKAPETDPPETKPAETQAPPETQAPTETAPPETQAPSETAPPETQAPSETAPPETQAPSETAPPETQAPSETAPPETQAPSETTPPETQAPSETAPPETQAPSETAPPETQAPSETAPPETQAPSETAPPETQAPTETVPPETEAPTETAPPETQAPAESETQAPTETAPPETEAPTEPETKPGKKPDKETESDKETETETETDAETETEKESEKESESETEKISNEELIARQKIVVPPTIEKEFRFTKVDKRYAVVKDPEGASVYEKKSSDAREVGTLSYYGCCFILEDQDDGWYYVESGNVRGFIEAERVVTDEVAERIARIKGEDELPTARLLVARPENAAFTYTHTTVQEVMAAKNYALASASLNIYEQKKDSSRAVGTMTEKELCYILADAGKEWVFVESGDVRGFVKGSQLITGQAAQSEVSDRGELNIPLADLLVKPEENKACYYTMTSVKEASQGAKTREAMINFAKQFLGNPYVWGGTSLTQGADCSGFVQSIYSYFGYSLPRVAEDQSRYGMQIPISSAEPGDLIFYARNGYVYHVSMYIGDGQVIHASGKNVGIIISGINGNAVWATRIIQD